MITTITLNPSIDRRYVVNGFEKGKIFRAKETQYTAGGKGLNVSKVIKDLGYEVIATGLLGGKSGEFISDELERLQIKNRFIEISNETRSCIAIISNDKSQTEILESGPEVNHAELEKFYDEFRNIVKDTDIICASGSLAKGIPISIYRDLIEIANKSKVKFILDTSGEALIEGIKALPYVVKPNKEELEKLIGTSINSETDLIENIIKLSKSGIKIIIVSLGGKGSIVAYNNKIYKIKIPEVKVENPVGSGDSMVAGLAVAIEKGLHFEEMMIFASACGTANAIEKETGKVSINNVKSLLTKIHISRIA